MLVKSGRPWPVFIAAGCLVLIGIPFAHYLALGFVLCRFGVPLPGCLALWNLFGW